MNVSRVFIQRPVATGLLMVAIVLAGLLGLRLLPISALPQVDYPTIQVQTLYPGGSPDVMSRTVTAPLERQFGQMSGLERMSSISAAGVSIVTMQFGLKEAMDTAEQQVQAAINSASTLLPADLPAPPVYAKVNPADAPVLTLAIRSDSLPLTEVQNMVNTRLAQKISQVSGVGLVTLAGGQKPAVRIQANIDALAAMGLGLDTVRSAINNANSNSAKGNFDGPTRAYTINANDQLATPEQYSDVIVAYKNGAPVRLRDVARVVTAAENDRLGAWAAVNSNDAGCFHPSPLAGEGQGERGRSQETNASLEQAPPLPQPLSHGGRGEKEVQSEACADLQPVILLNVQRQPGANVIATVDAIKRQLPALQASLPGSVSVEVLTDRTSGIRASVEHVQMELIMAVVMVVLVIFAFLHSLRATVIASIAVPISLLGSAGVMYLLGYSLNNLSLMALTIATGFVVDDAIVMIENISRHLEKGKPPMRAALDGAGEIGFTIVSLTVSLIAVLIPLLFMQEVIGRLFREFAVTLAITIILSAVVSLTLVPMMSARWLRPLDEINGKFSRRFQAGMDRVVHQYDRGLGWVLAHQTATLLVAVLTLALTAFLFWLMPKGLFPTQSTGQLQMTVVAAPDVSFERMEGLQRQVARVVLSDEATQSVSSVVGVDAANNTMLNQGSVVVNLRPQGVLGASQARIMQRLQGAVEQQVAGVRIYIQPTQDLTVDSERGPTEYRFSIEGVRTEEVNTWASKMVQVLQGVPQVRNPTTDAGASGPTAMVRTDRDTAARLGISASAIDDVLYNAFGQRIISTIFTETSQYRVILEAQRDGGQSLARLGDLPVRTSGGTTTPLSAFAQIEEQSAPLQVTRVAQYPAATVGFDTAPGVSLGAATQAIQAAAQQAGLPDGLTLHFTGTAGALQSSLSNQVWLLLAAIVCVYIVLGVLYESWVHPLTILSTLPSAGVGALLALWLTGHALDIVGIIGLVLLIGIVKKNAIMMIDFALDAERKQGMAAREAIHQAALLRFRPILMTTLAALAAALPLMFSWGDGAELRRPLGLSIFGGLVLSQLLTLFTTPVIYLWFDRWGRKWDRMGQGDDGVSASHRLDMSGQP